MSKRTYRSRVELGVAFACLIIGGFFALLAAQISPAAFDPIGPRALPLFLAIAISVLGIVIGMTGWRDRDTAETLPEDYGFRSSNLTRVAAVIGAGVAYLILFVALGYFAATLIGTALILLAFGLRGVVAIAITSVIASCLYQFVFMGAMGLNDPVGSLIDLSAISNLISGG